jgi:hypothetical protein
MGSANVLEFEPIAKTKLSKWAYEYIATGVEDEFTMRANSLQPCVVAATGAGRRQQDSISPWVWQACPIWRSTRAW